MQRFCRSHLLCIWCCALLVVSSYVLFDLLDIDGSDFDHSPGSGLVAEERIAREEGHPIPLELSAPALLPRHDQGAMLRSIATPIATLPRPVRAHGRPRGALSVQGTASPQPGRDPASPLTTV